MSKKNTIHKQIISVNSFEDLVRNSFYKETNAVCWPRELKGDFAEIVESFQFEENIFEIDLEALLKLNLSKKGQIARETLVSDFKSLTEIGAQPTLNIIKSYERDTEIAFFPRDVYSWHVDRSPIPGSTYLCTYHGAPSEILPNEYAQQKIFSPEIRNEIQQHYQVTTKDFELFIEENYFDLHYEAKTNAKTINLGLGNLWRLAVDSPQTNVLPCIHRAPKESDGKKRLLLIC